MITRIVSGLVLVGVVLALLIFAPSAWIVAAVGLAMVIGAWEWSAFLRPRGRSERYGFVALVTVLLAASWYFTADPRVLSGLLWIAALWWIVALAWVLARPGAASRAAVFVAGLLVLVPAGIGIARLRVDLADGAEWTLYALVLVFAADTGAYFSGRAFGRHKLAPAVSPGKTWEGVAGGLLLAAVWAAIGSRWLDVPAAPMVCGSVVIAGFSVVGDLIESLMKRHAGLKDSGHLIPGHGGIMDRLDSITAAAPLTLLFIIEVLPVAT